MGGRRANVCCCVPAKGAASLAASYINLANPGTYDAAPGTAPSFDTATGWTFAAASSQYLTTGIVFGVNWTILVRVGSATQSFGYLIGAQSTVRRSMSALCRMALPADTTCTVRSWQSPVRKPRQYNGYCRC